jgi:hypothetical protein
MPEVVKNRKKQNSLNIYVTCLACIAQVSISPTFYEQLLRQNPFAEKLQTQIVST